LSKSVNEVDEVNAKSSTPRFLKHSVTSILLSLAYRAYSPVR